MFCDNCAIDLYVQRTVLHVQHRNPAYPDRGQTDFISERNMGGI